MKKNYLLNEGYQKGIKFTGAKNQYIFTSKKKYLDFSMCSGTMFLGHAPNIFTNSLNFSKKRESLLVCPMKQQLITQNV